MNFRGVNGRFQSLAQAFKDSRQIQRASMDSKIEKQVYFERTHDRASDNLVEEFFNLDDQIIIGGYCIDSRV